MSYFVKQNNITIFKGDSAHLMANFKNLPNLSSGIMYMQINFPSPVLKQVPINVDDTGKARAAFDFTIEETEQMPVGGYSYAFKYTRGDIFADTITQNPEIETRFIVKNERVDN